MILYYVAMVSRMKENVFHHEPYLKQLKWIEEKGIPLISC